MIEGIQNKNVASLIAVFSKAEQEIIAKIAKTDFTKRAEKESTLKQIENILTGLYNPSEEFIVKYSTEEWQTGIQEVQEALAKIDYKGSFNLVDPKATQFVLENLKNIQDSSLSEVRAALSNSYATIRSSLNIISRDLRNSLISEIASGQIQGNPRKIISQKLADRLQENGIMGFSYTTESGKQRNLSLGAYVESLARSTLINSRASAVINTALENGYDLLKISSHGNESPMCRPWSGQIISISGQNSDYPTLSEALFKGDYKKGGIFHRYCRHSLTVYIPTDIQFK